MCKQISVVKIWKPIKKSSFLFFLQMYVYVLVLQQLNDLPCIMAYSFNTHNNTCLSYIQITLFCIPLFENIKYIAIGLTIGVTIFMKKKKFESLVISILNFLAKHWSLLSMQSNLLLFFILFFFFTCNDYYVIEITHIRQL